MESSWFPNRIHAGHAGSIIITGSQLRQDLRRWLSPPDPSTNHNIACNAHHTGTATWFFEGETYKEWKSTGSESPLWIHGKRAPPVPFRRPTPPNNYTSRFWQEYTLVRRAFTFLFVQDTLSHLSFSSSAIIQDIGAVCDAGRASMAYFYFYFRDINKQHWRDLVSSLLIQLSAQSGPRCDILSRLHSNHDSGARQPSDDILTRCLKEMLTLPDQQPIYLILDALDECSNVSGIPTSRKRVVQLVKELVDLLIPNLHICVTSRLEFDIRDVLEPLTTRRVSLHDQSGQKKDIEDYVGPWFTRTRNQSCGDGGRRIRNSSLRHSLNELMECK